MSFFKLFPRAQHKEDFDSTITHTLLACEQLNKRLVAHIVAATSITIKPGPDGSVSLKAFREGLIALTEKELPVKAVRLLFKVEVLCAATLNQTPLALPEWAVVKAKAAAAPKPQAPEKGLTNALAYVGQCTSAAELAALVNECQARLAHLAPAKAKKAKATA